MTRTVQVIAPKTTGSALNQATLSPGGKAPPQTTSSLAQLQSSFGNQAMLKLISGGVLRRKLTINRPGDIYEQEADRVADTVMRMTDPLSTRQPFSQANVSGRLQRCSCGKSASAEGQCDECKAMHRMENPSGSSVTASFGTTAPAIVHEVLRSPGQPLDAGARSFMEPRFGHDFGAVRVHDDAQAARSASAVNAMAYTVGNHLVFGQHQYAPSTVAGRSLLAHELTHVVQNRGSSAPSMVQRACSPPRRRENRDENEGQKAGVHELSSPCRWLLFGFPIASSEFILPFSPAVTQLVDFLGRNEKARLRLTGVADCFGSDETNRALATARAQNVKGAFPGDLQGQIELTPVDPKAEVVPNDSAIRRSLNRSVQVEIVPPPGVPCPSFIPLRDQGKPGIGKCDGHEAELKDAIRLSAALAVTAHSRLRNWRQNKGTRVLLDSFYRTTNDAEREGAVSRISAALAFMIPRLQSLSGVCLTKEDKDFAAVCPPDTMADAEGRGAVGILTFCMPQFIDLLPTRALRAGKVIHEFSHRFPGLSDMGRSYYDTDTCEETEKTRALTREQRLAHADTLSCFVLKAAIASP